VSESTTFKYEPTLHEVHFGGELSLFTHDSQVESQVEATQCLFSKTSSTGGYTLSSNNVSPSAHEVPHVDVELKMNPGEHKVQVVGSLQPTQLSGQAN